MRSKPFGAELPCRHLAEDRRTRRLAGVRLMHSMPDPFIAMLRDLGVDPEDVSGFTLTWDRFEGAKLEYRQMPRADLIEIEVTKEFNVRTRA